MKAVGIDGYNSYIANNFINKYKKKYKIYKFREDINNLKELKKFIKKKQITVFIRCAGLSRSKCESNKSVCNKTNYKANQKLIDYLKINKIKLIFLSTCHVYKISNKKIKESSAKKPNSLYGKLKLKSEEIINSINKIGFENTANLYSISESARFNGKLGWIEENQLSELIKAEIKKTKIGNYTTPIKIRDGYIILFVKDKKVEKEDFNIDKKTNKQIAYEKNKILNEFSRQYFKKVAINQIIE